MTQTSRKNRILSFLLMLCVTIALVLSTVFVVTHIDHTCTGEGCETCHQIAICVAIAHQLSEAGAGGAIGVCCAALIVFCRLLTSGALSQNSKTLILLKVRLND